MKLENLSSESQRGLRQWAADVHDDGLLFDANASAVEFWAWICFQLRISEDRPEWFPKGKFALIQIIEGRLYEEAFESMPAGTAFSLKR